MQKRTLFIFIVFFFFISTGIKAQVYLMDNTSVNACSGTFYDSGGNTGNYGNSENFTMTFCASTIGSCVRMVFTSFDIETNFDEMRIYDGPTTGSPLIGVYTGNTSPGLITANSGCLTIRFRSDGLFNYAGWAATVSCINCATGTCAVTCNGGPPPANDACAAAQNLGSLPAPAPCPSGIGGLNTTNTTNLCATAEVPYTSLLGCQPAGNMASPAADVWYRFSITGPSVNVNISGGLADPNVGLYEGTSCANLIPRGCAIGSNGTLNTTFSGLAAGSYYLQVSGGSITDQCDFTITLQNNYDCAGCVIQSSLDATPPPVNGTYPAGQLVTFCYTISDYNQTSANWLHGVIPTFGPGWDMSTFTPSPVTDCSGSGSWNWYSGNITSTATGAVSGPGFYYESALGNALAVVDGNPGNNFGDNNGTNNCDWVFCWTIKTLPVGACVQGTNLNIGINTQGDGESGSWGSLACTQDPVTNFFASLTCCQAPVVNVTQPLCPGQSTGSATAQGAGNSPWDYVWTNAAGVVVLTQNNISGSSTLSNIAQGSYTVSVTDNTGCNSNSAFTINAPSAFSAVMNTTNLTCNGNNTGTASVVVNGGTPGFTYSWAPSGNGSNPMNLAAGNYTVTVTDANGCTTTVSNTITEPAVINASISSKTNVTCEGGQDGAVTVTTAGGTAPYSYSWSTGAAGSSLTGLTAGAYTVTVTDAHGCTGFMTIAITQPQAIVLSFSSTSSSCGNANGSATVSPLGGTPGYTYAWSPSGGSANIASNLSAGGYNVTVTDSRGCTVIGNVVVSNSSGPTASIAFSTDVTCFGGADATATANVSGGTPPLVYSWTPSGGAGLTASNLAAGNYTFTVTDGTGCSSAASVIIVEPNQLLVNITANIPASCSNENDGSLTAQGNGGVPNYSYVWSGGSVNASDNFLTPGTYTVTVTDVNGCTAITSATVSSPAPLQASILNSTPTTCNGVADGTANAQAVGGTSPYSFQWSNGTIGSSASGLAAGNYTVTVTDAHGCTSKTTVTISSPSPMVLNVSFVSSTCGTTNGSASVVVNGGTPPYSYNWTPTGGTGTSATNLSSGNYSVVVTDANGCISIGNAVVPSADGPVLTLNSTVMVTCPGGADGSIDVSVTGGVLPYTLLWSNGASGTNLSNLSGGIYTFTVTDDNNCSSAIIVNITQPPPFVINMNPVTAHCGQADGSIAAVVAGGTPALTYAWSSGASITNQLNGIIAGTYTLTVTDSKGCTASAQSVVADVPAPVVSVNNIIDATCFGAADGKIRVNIAGGVAPYTYVWSNGTIGALNSNVVAGTYTVTATDNFGCTATLQTIVNQPAQLVLLTNSTAATCGANTGTAGVIVNGGTPAYQYLWTPSGGMNATAAGLGAGSYTVVVTDNNGCTEQSNVTVQSSNGPSVAVLLATDVSCSGGSDGALTIAVNGGAAPYSYLWSSGGSGISGSNLSAGNYTVTVTDANNCSATLVAIINAPAPLGLVTNAYAAHCGQSDGSADVLVNGGTPGYAYSWSTGTSINTTISNMPSGNYTVTVTDSKGCMAQQTINIGDQSGPGLVVASLNDVACNGGANGSVGVATVNGNAPFTFAWSNGSSAAVNSNLTAGTYTVTVTDNFGCTSTLQSVISEPAAMQLSFNNTTSTCGNANGTSIVTPSGGAAPYAYFWSSGSLSSTAAALAAGIYTVTVTGNDGCTISQNTIINSAGGPVLAAGPLTNVSCAGGADGTASVLVVSGNGPFSFGWLPYGGVAATATGLSPGNYKVSVTDINGCSTALNFDITAPDPLIVNNLTMPASCFGGNDGTADIDAQGGTAPYTYDWSPGGVLTANRINLQAGNYDVIVTDSKGCTQLTTAVVSQPTALSGLLTPTDASCFGGDDGSADIVAAGGTPPYTFLWNDGSSNTQLTNLSAGTYTVTITDNHGCTHAETVNVGQALAINLAVIAVDATCGSANGNAQVNGNGGTGVLSYQWSTGVSSATINSLAAGAYTVIATDANGCTQSATTTIADLGGPSVSLLSSNDALCNGSSDGDAEVVVNSGNGPYTYLWLPLGGNAAAASGLPAGAYSVTVTDVNGCIGTVNIGINEPTVLSVQLSSSQALCGAANGSATALVNGGTAPYLYTWSSGQLTATANALLPGNYSVTVTDDKGCTYSDNILVNTSPAMAVQSSSTDATCFNGASGTAEVLVNSGATPFTYNWSDGQSASQAINLMAGSYTVTVTDANGCTVEETVAVGQAPAIVLNVSTTAATCGGSNGTASVNGIGGTGLLSYLWSGGQITSNLNTLSAGSYTVTATDANACTADLVANVSNLGGPQAVVLSNADVTCFGGSNGTAEISVSSGNGPYSYQWQPFGGNTTQATGLTAGNYAVIITDVNGCVGNIGIIINEPPSLNIQLSTSQATCGNANGSVAAVVSGGTGAYQYSWSNGAAVTSSINLLASGMYTVTVTDANNCTSSSTAALSNAGGPVLAVNNVSPASCNGGADGTATVVVNTGNGPYSYSWNPLGGNAPTASGLSAGNYAVSVTDVNGCSSQQVVIIQEPASLSLQTTVTPTQCNANNGSAQVMVSGGVGNYNYSWSSGSSTDLAGGLNIGNYTVTVSDGNACTATASVNVTGLQGPAISSVNTNDALCFGAADGSAQVQFSNGVSPYTFSWSNGSSASGISGLAAGNYTVTVTDNFGCSDAKPFVIQQPQLLSLTVVPVNMVSCFGGNDGSATANAAGGTAPYSYAWSTGSSGSSAGSLSAGSYTLVITDQHGCTVTKNTTISEPALLSLSQQALSMVSCYGGSNGSASFTVSGGTNPYSYSWSNGGTSSGVNNLPAGTYTLTVTDGKGCLTDSTIFIAQPSAINFNTAVIKNVSCFNGNNGQLGVSNYGGSAPYTYQWSNGATTANLSNLSAGSYTVTVSDLNACVKSMTLLVNQPAVLSVQSSVSPIPCYGDNNAVISVMANGGVPPYYYSWSNGVTSNIVSSLSPGSYTLTITDGNNCIFDTTYGITQPTLLTAVVASADTLCIGQSASLTAVVNGGTPAYSYQWNNSALVNSILVSPAVSATYSVTITDANGCDVTVGSIQVPVFPALSVNLTVSDDTLCEGESTQLLAVASGGNGGPYTYSWNAISTNIAGFTGTPDTTYPYQVSISDGCTVFEPAAQQLVVVHPLPVVNFTPLKAEGCNPVSVLFSATGQTSPGAVYNWTFGDNTIGTGSAISHTYIQDGSFDVSLHITDIHGCENEKTQTNLVTVFPLPIAFYTSDPQEVSILRPIVQFINGSTGASSAHWDFGDATANVIDWSPEHTFSDTGRFKVELIAISTDGCVDTFYNEIIVKGETTFYVPNAFSPNDDGDNEIFTGYGIGIRHADFFVFDRWGKMIFQSNTLEKGWNGKYQNSGDECPEGTYVYLFKVYGELPAPTEYTGRVTLVR